MLKVKFFLIIFIACMAVFCLIIFSRQPSLERNWEKDQEILPHTTFSGSEILIENMRNFNYTTTTDYEVSYYNQSFDISQIESLYYIIEPFGEYDGPAHTMFSFGLSDGSFIVISAEIRKEVGESFSPLKGLIREYEIVYMIGSEKDFVKLRANYREDEVIVYPVKTPKEKIQKLFISMLNRANDLAETPEFYNTLTNNCTTNILSHVNELREEKISWSKEALLPSHSDQIIYDLGLINTSLSLSEARKYYKINELSLEFSDDENYSQKIRKVVK